MEGRFTAQSQGVSPRLDSIGFQPLEYLFKQYQSIRADERRLVVRARQLMEEMARIRELSRYIGLEVPTWPLWDREDQFRSLMQEILNAIHLGEEDKDVVLGRYTDRVQALFGPGVTIDHIILPALGPSYYMLKDSIFMQQPGVVQRPTTPLQMLHGSTQMSMQKLATFFLPAPSYTLGASSSSLFKPLAFGSGMCVPVHQPGQPQEQPEQPEQSEQPGQPEQPEQGSVYNLGKVLHYEAYENIVVTEAISKVLDWTTVPTFTRHGLLQRLLTQNQSSAHHATAFQRQVIYELNLSLWCNKFSHVLFFWTDAATSSERVLCYDKLRLSFQYMVDQDGAWKTIGREGGHGQRKRLKMM